MGRLVELATAHEVSREEVYDVVLAAGGVIDHSRNQGIIGRRHGPVIWIYYRVVDKIEQHYDEDEAKLLEEAGIQVKRIVAVDLSSHSRSVQLARKFCKRFMRRYATTVLDDGYRLYTYEQFQEFNRL
ncbi:hypothetical protein [Paenibacillus sp. YYML68]|uniref:hypothetical protein n=1 Tax=Paenibacillus sp. YYML68 TaxID=2909250 RepID=UPI0024937D33|nr:hypothetical protein [Paenibacillus sp. YYML68]